MVNVRNTVWVAIKTQAVFVSTILILTIILSSTQVYAQSNETYADFEITIADDGRSFVSGSSNVNIAEIWANDTVNVYTDSLTAKKSNIWTFNLSSEPNLNVSASYIKVHLPQNVVINAIKSLQSSNIEYDKSITVIFVGKNEPVQILMQYSFAVTSSDTGAANSNKSSSNSNNAQSNPMYNYGIYAIISAVVIIGIGVVAVITRVVSGRKRGLSAIRSVFSIYTHNSQDPNFLLSSIDVSSAKYDTLRPTLNETQLKIIDAIIASKGVATQNKIHHSTQIPKASLSRNIEILCRKQILQKISGGYTNQISIGNALKNSQKNA